MSSPAATKTDLLLLGLLLDRPMHGYEMYQHIQAEGVDAWFNISTAGVYYSLGKLRDQGLVAESRQQGRRSSRKSTYRLTEQGRTSFFAALEDQLASEDKDYLDYDLAVYLLNRLPLQRALPRLEQRQEHLAARAQAVQAAWEAEQNDGESPLKLAILEHRRRYLDMERAWLAQVISDVRANGEGTESMDTAGRGLMILGGDLRDFHLPDLLRLIVSGQHSGILTITTGAEVRTLLFREGRPVCGSYERLGDPLEDSKPEFSPEVVIDRLCELFRKQEGQFSFHQRNECQEWGVSLDCSAEELILRGCRKVEDWSIIQRLVPSADAIFELGSLSQRLDQVALTPIEKRVVAAVDGVKDVATVAQELDLTLFETSRAFYCLTATGALRAADPGKIRLRRVFHEIAELMCSGTLAWRISPDDDRCEQEVNKLCAHLPLRLHHGRLEDQTDPQLGADDLRKMYQFFLQQQYNVISRRFGRSNARQSYERTLSQLAPELQDVAGRYGFDRIAAD